MNVNNRLATVFPDKDSKERMVLESFMSGLGFVISPFQNFTDLATKVGDSAFGVVMFQWSESVAPELDGFMKIVKMEDEEEKCKILAFNKEWDSVKLRIKTRMAGCDDLLAMPPISAQICKALGLAEPEVKTQGAPQAPQPKTGVTLPKPEAAIAAGDKKGVVLVVDDASVMRLSVRHVVEQMGYGVMEAEDGSFAYNMAVSKSPLLVVTDLMMPLTDGFTLIERLRSTPSTAKIPVIVLSSYGDKERILRALRMGANDFMVKPFQPEILRAKISRRIEASR